jgi:hypothetical protein
LPAGKARSLGAIGINTRESLTICVVDGHLPMTMLSTPVFAQCRALFGFLQGLVQLWSQKYLKFPSSLQVLVEITRLRKMCHIFGIFCTSAGLASVA